MIRMLSECSGQKYNKHKAKLDMLERVTVLNIYMHYKQMTGSEKLLAQNDYEYVPRDMVVMYCYTNTCVVVFLAAAYTTMYTLFFVLLTIKVILFPLFSAYRSYSPL